MCKKCKPHKTYWVHIADGWSETEKKEMLEYLKNGNMDNKPFNIDIRNFIINAYQNWHGHIAFFFVEREFE